MLPGMSEETDKGTSAGRTTGRTTEGTTETTGPVAGPSTGRAADRGLPPEPAAHTRRTAHALPRVPADGRRCGPSQGPLFTYGTLQFDAVLRALLGRIPERTEDSAPGWRAAALAGRLYPGLVAAPGATVGGLLLTGLSDEEWAVLDAFEDEEYDLREIGLASGRRAWTYVWAAGDVEEADWDAARFAARHLPAYAARCVDELRTG